MELEKVVTKPFSILMNLTVWLTGILVSLAVGFGMADGVLTIRWIPLIVTNIAGWIVCMHQTLKIGFLWDIQMYFLLFS